MEAFRAIRALRRSTSSSSSKRCHKACSKRWTASRSTSSRPRSSLRGGSQGSPQGRRAHSNSPRRSTGHSRAPCPCSNSSRGSCSSCRGRRLCSSHSRHGSRRHCRSRPLWRLRSRACRVPCTVSSSTASKYRRSSSSSWGSRRLIWRPATQAAQGSKPGSSGPLCSCPSRSPCPGPLGNWQHPLGQSPWRGLDGHISSMVLALSRCSISRYLAKIGNPLCVMPDWFMRRVQHTNWAWCIALIHSTQNHDSICDKGIELISKALAVCAAHHSSAAGATACADAAQAHHAAGAWAEGPSRKPASSAEAASGDAHFQSSSLRPGRSYHNPSWLVLVSPDSWAHQNRLCYQGSSGCLKKTSSRQELVLMVTLCSPGLAPVEQFCIQCLIMFRVQAPITLRPPGPITLKPPGGPSPQGRGRQSGRGGGRGRADGQGKPSGGRSAEGSGQPASKRPRVMGPGAKGGLVALLHVVRHGGVYVS